jgi:hypothetical protein
MNTSDRFLRFAAECEVMAKFSRCPFRKSYPRVAMMESGKDWYGDDSPGSLDGSS